ncbi:DUF3157 family protein [Cognatitamlana onchidii]|uniref:DUF3157 family protein n=1 Tax=Cognatitamlana onchidii TaxID=2562860 RepID=UPI0010A6B01F|nr:DUF3157 family protein [Algibacter onchidii]
MKISIAFVCLFVVTFGFSQNNYIVKTEDGRRVLLKADYTWEYIDLEVPVKKETDTTLVAESESKKINNCNLAEDFTEPKLNSKIQAQLKKGRATMKHVKAKVAKDHNCEVEDVILLTYKEQKEKGNYTFCANGTKVAYKRMGNSIIKKGKLF